MSEVKVVVCESDRKVMRRWCKSDVQSDVKVMWKVMWLIPAHTCLSAVVSNPATSLAAQGSETQRQITFSPYWTKEKKHIKRKWRSFKGAKLTVKHSLTTLSLRNWDPKFRIGGNPIIKPKTHGNSEFLSRFWTKLQPRGKVPSSKVERLTENTTVFRIAVCSYVRQPQNWEWSHFLWLHWFFRCGAE